MFATYIYSTTASPAEVRADLLALICGADVNSLSASCVKAVTTRGGVASGWVAHDAANWVMKGVDALGGDKFARLNLAGLVVNLCVLESWNAVAHTGVNATTAANVCNVAAGVTGTINIIANDEAIAIWAGSYWAAAIEAGRDSPLMAAPYPVGMLISNTAAAFYSPRVKNGGAAGDLLNALMTANTVSANSFANALRGVGEVLYFPVMPLAVTYGGATFYGWLREFFSLPMAGAGQRVSGDVFFDGDGKRFVCLPVSASALCWGVERR